MKLSIISDQVSQDLEEALRRGFKNYSQRGL